MSCPGSSCSNSLRNEGARDTTTGLGLRSSAATRGTSSRTRLAPLGQAATQAPQATHRSGITTAWAELTRMALTGQARTHL